MLLIIQYSDHTVPESYPCIWKLYHWNHSWPTLQQLPFQDKRKVLRHQIILFESKLFQESRKEVTWKIMNPPTDKPIYFFLEDLDYHIYRLDGHANQPFIVAARSINVGGKRQTIDNYARWSPESIGQESLFHSYMQRIQVLSNCFKQNSAPELRSIRQANQGHCCDC